MGSWMEVLRQRPNLGATREEYRSDLLAEIFPGPLLDAIQHVPRAMRDQFPLLRRVRKSSEWYEDEAQVLNTEGAGALLNELVLLRKVCQRKVYFKGVDGSAIYHFWRKYHTNAAFEGHLDEIENLLRLAVDQKAWVKMEL